MSKRSKLLTILLSVCLLFGAITALFASAEDTGNATTTAESPKTAEVPGKFLYYKASNGSFNLLDNSAFEATVDAMNIGDTIKLLSDLNFKAEYTDSDKKPWASPSTKGESLSKTHNDFLYLDLNGYQLSMQLIRENASGTGAAGTHALFDVQSDTTFCVYSSDDNSTASIHAIHTMQDGTETKGIYGSIFGMTSGSVTNAHVYLGDVENARKLSYTLDATGENVSEGSVTVVDKIDGDNLNTYAPRLLLSAAYSSTLVPAQDSSFRVSGGNHYCVSSLSSAHIFDVSGSIDIYANGASFFSTVGSAILKFDRGTGSVTKGGKTYYTSPADSNVEMESCLLYTEGTVITNLYESTAEAEYNTKTSHVKFTNCSLIGSKIHTITKGAPEYINCQFNMPVSGYENDGSKVLAKTNTLENIALYEAGWTDSWDLTKTGEKRVALLHSIASENGCVDITWKSQGNTLTETWLKGDVYPMPAFFADSSDVYTYDYLPEITTTEESDSRTYTLSPITKFTVQANVSLHSSFTFNLYIPKTAGDSKTITGKWIERADGTRLADVTFDESKTKIISGIEHYVVSQDILATEGDAEYRFVLEMKGAFGETITKKLEFSIFDYADKVEKAAVPDSAKSLVQATRTYIKAAMNFFAGEKGAELPYEVETDSLIEIALKNKSETQTKNPLFTAATLSPGEQISFVFYFAESAEGSVTFSYTQNLTRVAKTVDVSGRNFYVIPLKAADLCEKITADVNGDGKADYSFSLANYIFAKQNDKDSLVALTGAIWAYSKAARAYITDTASPDTPDVELSVAGEKITGESYVIVADLEKYSAAATALRDAILAKTGEEIEICSEAQDGMHSIYVNLTEPSLYYDFEVTVDGHDLVMNCSFKSFIEDGMSAFISKRISALNNSSDFAANFVDNYYSDRFYYSDFNVPTVDMTKIKKEYQDINKWYNHTYENYYVLKEVKETGAIEDALDGLIEAHNFANESKRHTVYADEDKIYYIDTSVVTIDSKQIFIKTNVNWGSARFILDDSVLGKYHSRDVFSVESDHAAQTITDTDTLGAIVAAGLNPDTTEIKTLALGYRAMIITNNSKHKVYRRKGAYTSWEGGAMSELVILDKDGNIDPTTRLIFDYNALDKITVYNLDVPQITIEGGHVTTIACQYIQELAASGDPVIDDISRGLVVKRPNTTVKNLVHDVIGEHERVITLNGKETAQYKGATYDGFFSVSNTSDVLFYNCKLQGRRLYKQGDSTYEIDLKFANNCVFDTCEQTNFYVDFETNLPVTPDTEYKMLCLDRGVIGENGNYLNHTYQACWGAMGGNNCKNISYENSRISRFDAHEGVYNGSIINSDVQTIALTGWGTFTIENTNIHGLTHEDSAEPAVTLRGDYGNTWGGTIILKNVDVSYATRLKSTNPPTLINAAFSNWYYGYQCAFPNVLIDGLEYYSDLNTKDLTNPTASVNDSAKLLSASELGEVKVYRHDFAAEPDLHLENTKNTTGICYYRIEDLDGDGIMDGSEDFTYSDGTIVASIVFEGLGIRRDITFPKGRNESGSGILMTEFDKTWTDANGKTGTVAKAYGFGISEGYKNQNPIKAPTSITIVNNTQGYDYESYLNSAKEAGSTFFDNTAISVGLKYEVVNGIYAKVTGYNGSATEVVIADEYNGLPVKEIADYAFKGSTITSIVIPKSVSIIGKDAFRSCESLTSATFENPDDWFVASAPDATSGTYLTLTNPSKNATYLKNNYYSKYWIYGADIHTHKCKEEETPLIPYN